MDKLSNCLARKQNHKLLRLMPFLFLMLLVALSAHVTAQEAVEGIPESYAMVAENEQFQLYVDSSTLAFKLLDKRNGYLWHSGIDEAIDGDRLNSSWRAFAQSGISIEYFDKRATNSRTSIANAIHTLTVTDIEQGISAEIRFDDFGITLGLRLQLEEEGVRVEVPSSTIREENPDFRLAKVYIYPFLGATRGSSIAGYMFLPDGVGSIVRFADTTNAHTMYYGRYYGADLGMIGTMPYDPLIVQPSPISFPVYGMVHGEGQNAFLSIVEKGASYGQLEMHPAGIITNFNFVYNAFIYNQTYFQATNLSGAGVSTVQRRTNQFDAVLHYRFLSDATANYVGMARSYQDYLLENGLLHGNEDPNPNIGIRLEFLGGDKEKVLLWDSFVTMTTINQVNAILDDLQIPNSEVIYYGWQSFGASAQPATSLQIETSLGSLSDLNALAQRVVADGGHFSLYLDPQAALWGESGYSTRNDIAMAITNVPLDGYSRTYNYYFSFNALQNRYTALSTDIAENLDSGLALDGIASMVYSDFRDNQQLNREAAIAAYQNLLRESSLRLAFYRPNDYFWGLAQAYYDMPLGDNAYIFTSETVPFLPIVLAGYVPYYGTALNFSSNLQDDLLRQVEYGIYPSYFLTNEPTALLINTRSSWIYTSSFAQWGDEVRNTYEWMNALLAPVRGQEIIEHEALTTGVYATTYANGNQIIVNYNEIAFESGAIRVEARNAVLLETRR